VYLKIRGCICFFVIKDQPNIVLVSVVRWEADMHAKKLAKMHTKTRRTPSGGRIVSFPQVRARPLPQGDLSKNFVGVH
jgi:hypothetical protein